MSNKAKKHHFISRFILNKFYSLDNKLHTFNKNLDKLNIKGKSSKSLCYEEGLYTVYIENESCVEIENFYSTIESQFSNLIKMIESDEKDFFLFQENIQACRVENSEHWKIISFFLSLSFWRLPNTYSISEKLRKNLRGIYNNASDEIKSLIPMNSKELKFFEKSKSKFAQKITNYIILPACLSEINDSILECKFIQTDFDLVISDRPIICSIDKATGEICGDIYMPLSPRLCITNNIDKILDFQKEMFLGAENIVIANSDNVLINIYNQVKEIKNA